MLLSFSEPAMRPWVENGIRQAHGEDVGDARVKRQTIRRRGPRAEKLLAHAENAGWTHPYDLHLWWKSRTPERICLGVIRGGGRVYPVTLSHSIAEPFRGPSYPIVRISGPRGWRNGDDTLFWAPGDEPAFVAEAYADGFNSPEAFRDYFVPNVGDVFEGVLFKW